MNENERKTMNKEREGEELNGIEGKEGRSHFEVLFPLLLVRDRRKEMVLCSVKRVGKRRKTSPKMGWVGIIGGM